MGPHTFPIPHDHERHEHWLHAFSPRERHRLIEDDERARMHIVGILLSAVFFGMTIYAIAVLFGGLWG